MNALAEAHLIDCRKGRPGDLSATMIGTYPDHNNALITHHSAPGKKVI